MLADLQAIQVHLWIITGLLATILVAAGYCNYSRIKEQAAVSPYKHLKDLWEREQFTELRKYTFDYLKTRPNTSDVLVYHAMVLLHFKQYNEARSAAEKLARAAPELRETSARLVEAIDAEAGS